MTAWWRRRGGKAERAATELIRRHEEAHGKEVLVPKPEYALILMVLLAPRRERERAVLMLDEYFGLTEATMPSAQQPRFNRG